MGAEKQSLWCEEPLVPKKVAERTQLERLRSPVRGASSSPHRSPDPSADAKLCHSFERPGTSPASSDSSSSSSYASNGAGQQYPSPWLRRDWPPQEPALASKPATSPREDRHRDDLPLKRSPHSNSAKWVDDPLSQEDVRADQKCMPAPMSCPFF